MLEIYLLEQLDAFKKFGTLRSAAQHLHMSQPSLTRSMQKIESILDIQILNRHGNRVTLNDAGEVVAKYAEKILAEEQNMIKEISHLKQLQNSLTLGSVAPGPLFTLLPKATQLFSDLTITSCISDEPSLLYGLNTNEYEMIILNHPVSDPAYFCQKYTSEQLYLSINQLHPAASCKSVSFSDLDGQNFIIYSEIGTWHDIVKNHMPHSTFFEQTSLEAVAELTKYSDLPSFATDLSIAAFPKRKNHRIFIPFSDKESKAYFYLICLKNKHFKWKVLF